MHHEDKEVEVMAEEMLKVPPEWNEVPDLMMETEEGRIIAEAATLRKRDEVAHGLRNWRREDEICLEKCEHSPTVQSRTCNPVGFYSKEWAKSQQEPDDWQGPDKWQRIAHMVFCGGDLEIHPSCAECISLSCTQHQRGGCSTEWLQKT